MKGSLKSSLISTILFLSFTSKRRLMLSKNGVECLEQTIMLTTKATPEMIAEWQRLFESHREGMHPNRKTGGEVDLYFRKEYPYQEVDNNEFCKVVAANSMENEYLRNKLANDMAPVIKCYYSNEVMVGIDLSSGEFHLEGKDINQVILLYDDLFAYRGLDEEDLENYFLVAEYIRLTQK